VIGISSQNTKAAIAAYDPTCGSGSLLLKVAAQAGKHMTPEGQEKDVTTAGLARMNMILHDRARARCESDQFPRGQELADSPRPRRTSLTVAAHEPRTHAIQ
jgi:type I restriction enzyme M protein